ncbi:MAG: VWA domain-containing protein [Chitinophagaceae bacterium]|nr:VWA domain-containing protein [Chitinophagaceae bacterium]
MFSFQQIQYLFILVAIPFFIVLFFYILNWKKKTVKKIGDERLVKQLIKSYSPKKFAIKFILIITAFALSVLALANLRSANGSQKINRNGIDVMLALDVSKSMLAQDVQPARLDRAKQVLYKLIDKLGNDRVGIVIFAGRAYLQMPLTGDHGAAKMYLATANTDAVPTQGTVIGDALKMCYSSFNTKEKKYKSVVLISDGEDHDEEAVKIAKQMAKEGVVINTVGIGSAEGATIIDAITNEVKKDKDGNEVISKLNETTLKQVAENSNGVYQLFNSTDETVAVLNKQLNSMDQRTVTEDSLVNYKTYFQWFLLAALFLLIAEQFISEKKSLVISATKKMITSFACLLPLFSVAQTQKATIKKGNQAYKKNEFEEAARQYKKVLDKNKDNQAALFNYGNAKYKTTKIDDAIGAYDKFISLSTDKIAKSQAYYNKGVVYQNAKNLKDCITSYKNALRLNPADEDARQNLQKALQQHKQQQKKEQENKKKNKPKEDENKKDKEKPKDDQEKNNQPKPQPSKINKQEAEEKLKVLTEKEKNLQDKLKKASVASPVKPEKDW